MALKISVSDAAGSVTPWTPATVPGSKLSKAHDALRLLVDKLQSSILNWALAAAKLGPEAGCLHLLHPM